jgi:hypothetical protein
MGRSCIALRCIAFLLAGLGIETQTKHSLFARLDLSFGLKALGRDLTSDVSDAAAEAAAAAAAAAAGRLNSSCLAALRAERMCRWQCSCSRCTHCAAGNALLP